MKEQEEIIVKIQKFFQKEKDVSFVYLFGSFASGKVNQMSDVDLAVYLDIKDKKQGFKKRCLLIGKLLHVLKKELDLVVLNDVEDNFLLYDILTQGKIIDKKDSDLFFDYKTKTIHSVLDFITRYNYVKQRENSTDD